MRGMGPDRFDHGSPARDVDPRRAGSDRSVIGEDRHPVELATVGGIAHRSTEALGRGRNRRRAEGCAVDQSAEPGVGWPSAVPQGHTPRQRRDRKGLSKTDRQVLEHRRLLGRLPAASPEVVQQAILDVHDRDDPLRGGYLLLEPSQDVVEDRRTGRVHLQVEAARGSDARPRDAAPSSSQAAICDPSARQSSHQNDVSSPGCHRVGWVGRREASSRSRSSCTAPDPTCRRMRPPYGTFAVRACGSRSSTVSHRLDRCR